jgi:hypothetical protein
VIYFKYCRTTRSDDQETPFINLLRKVVYYTLRQCDKDGTEELLHVTKANVAKFGW